MKGSSVKYQGDIDNRLKVLFDALRMPRETQEVEDEPQSPDENPCFCLLADDKFIDRISVTMDRLLVPPQSNEPLNDVELIITVSAVLFDRRFQVSPI
jgi:hypothetical protein